MNDNLIVSKIIRETASDDLEWVFIGGTKEKKEKYYIFVAFKNIIGNKFLVLELHIYENIHLNKLKIYMQNSLKSDKINIRDILKNIKVLSKIVISHLYNYSNDKKFKKVYMKLKKEYSNY